MQSSKTFLLMRYIHNRIIKSIFTRNPNPNLKRWSQSDLPSRVTIPSTKFLVSSRQACPFTRYPSLRPSIGMEAQNQQQAWPNQSLEPTAGRCDTYIKFCETVPRGCLS